MDAGPRRGDDKRALPHDINKAQGCPFRFPGPSGVYKRLTAAGLPAIVIDLGTEPYEELRHCLSDVWKKLIDETRNEERDLDHLDTL